MFDDLITWPYRAMRDEFGFWVALAWLAIAADVAILFGLVLGWPANLLWALGALRCAPWVFGSAFVLAYSYFWGRRHPHVS